MRSSTNTAGPSPSGPECTPIVAKELLKLAFPDVDKQRMSQVTTRTHVKGRSPTMSKRIWKVTNAVGSFLGLVKSKARRSLQNSPQQ